MPVQSIWMIRLSLGYLLCIAFLGSLLLIHKTVEIHPALWSLLPVHYEMAIWGWLLQFVMGTAYWMFPRYLKGPKRGSPRLAWMVVVSLNFGLWLLLVSYFIQFSRYTKLAGRSLIIISVLLFVSLMWRRVVSYRKFDE